MSYSIKFKHSNKKCKYRKRLFKLKKNIMKDIGLTKRKNKWEIKIKSIKKINKRIKIINFNLKIDIFVLMSLYALIVRK
jgi:hypothetical protein